MSTGLDPIVISTPDGVEHEFPPGTQPAAIRTGIANYMAQKSGAPTPAQEAIQPNPLLNPIELGIDAATAIPNVVRTMARAPLSALATKPLSALASHELPQALGAAATRVTSGGKSAVGKFLAKRIPVVHTIGDLIELGKALKGVVQAAETVAPKAASAAEEASAAGRRLAQHRIEKAAAQKAESKIVGEITPKGAAASRVGKGPAFSNPNAFAAEAKTTQQAYDVLRKAGYSDPAGELAKMEKIFEKHGIKTAAEKLDALRKAIGQ